MSTPKGRQYQLTLQDGSKVWLNAASSIRYPTAFTGNTRDVEITGEAYFEVKHNAQQPFRVRLPNGSIVEDIGTSFNVNAYNDEADIKTTLIEGSVRVLSSVVSGMSPAGGGGSDQRDMTGVGRGVVLKPGEQAEATSNSLLTTRSVDLDAVMSWKNGYFSFNNADIKTVMRQLSRWYDVDVIYQGEIPNEKLEGKIPRNVNASVVLDALQYTGIKFKIEGKKIIVMK
jgi:ferric-dicitrate binding protein FerR (iron transport regulator)